MLQVSIYRYNPETDSAPYMQEFQVDTQGRDIMVLDVLHLVKEQDNGMAYRRSCREGVCGSDGMNMNGKNGLACITPLSEVVKNGKLVLRPLPGLPVIRDLVVDMGLFYKQYERIQPYLQNDTPAPAIERLQSPEDRDKLDGLYECILCACCSTSCPSFWWNPDKFVGPAGLLQSYRFLADSRDTATRERLAELEDPFSVFRCRGIMNCVAVCPTGALLPKNQNFRYFDVKKTRTTCSFCGVGCQIDILTKNEKIVGVEPHLGTKANDGLLCVKGRFSWHFVQHPDRLKEPLIKENGRFREASWEEALDLVASRMKQIKQDHGPDAIAGFSSARCTNEDNYLFQKLLRAGVGTNNVDHCARL